MLYNLGKVVIPAFGGNAKIGTNTTSNVCVCFHISTNPLKHNLSSIREISSHFYQNLFQHTQVHS